MVDNVLCRQQRAVLIGCPAELREQILTAVSDAAKRDLLGEIGDDALAAL